MHSLSPMKSVLISLAGLLVIVYMILDTSFGAQPNGGKNRRAEIHFDLGGSSEKEASQGDDTNQDSGGEKKRGEARRMAKKLMGELVALAAEKRLNEKTFRNALKKQRLRLNLALVSVVANRRTLWLDKLKGVLEALSLVALLFLLGPLYVFKKVNDDHRRRAVAVASIPYFIVTAAVTMVVANGIASLVVSIQKLQVVLASFGSPQVAVTDAVLHFGIYSGKKELLSLAHLLGRAGDAVREDPMVAAGLLYHLWDGLQVIRESALLKMTANIIALLARLVELYGPLLALATLVVTYRVVVPVLRSVFGFPLRAIEEKEQAAIWPFLKTQIKVLWQEFRVAVWMFVFILLLVVLAVVGIRAATLPVVTASIRVLLAYVKTAFETGVFPNTILVLSTLSLGIFLAMITLFFFVPIGITLSKTYTMLRARVREKRSFRSFPEYWRLLKLVLLRIIMVTVGVGTLIVALYFLLSYLLDSTTADLYLPAVLFSPVFLLAVWGLRLGPILLEAARLDPVSLQLSHERLS